MDEEDIGSQTTAAYSRIELHKDEGGLRKTIYKSYYFTGSLFYRGDMKLP